MVDSISTRCAKLNQIFAGKNVGRKTSGAFTREALLDAFLLLFDECNSEYMLKDKSISGFVKKCKYMESFCVCNPGMMQKPVVIMNGSKPVFEIRKKTEQENNSYLVPSI